MSENAVNAAAADTLGRRLDQLTAALKKQANRRPAVTRYALAACATVGLLGAGYAGWKEFLHTKEPAEVQATPAAVEGLPVEKAVKTTLKVESAYVTSSGLVLLNSKRNFKDADNVTVVLPAGSGYTRESKNALVGRTFVGLVIRSSYQGRPELRAVAGQWALQ
jgi:hypothetical protein